MMRRRVLVEGIAESVSGSDVRNFNQRRARLKQIERVSGCAGKVLRQGWRQLRVEPEGHATSRAWVDRRAANSRHAWMSSDSRSGKSVRISVSGALCASISSTSTTRMRMPRIQACPPHWAGLEVMRASSLESWSAVMTHAFRYGGSEERPAQSLGCLDYIDFEIARRTLPPFANEVIK